VEETTNVIPKELEILNPEWQKKPIMLGKKVLDLYPLTEGQAEKLSRTIGDILYDLYNTDYICPVCNRVYKDAGGSQSVCSNKKCEGALLESLQKNAIDAILGKHRIRSILCEILGITEAEVRRGTIPQLRYIAGILFVQNFDDALTLPEGSAKNFQRLLVWMGMAVEKREPQFQSEKSTKPLPTSMATPVNISKENGIPAQEDVPEKD
jgi:hypothetical protein